MVSSAFRLAVLPCAIATSPLLAQQTAAQLATPAASIAVPQRR